MKFNLATLVSRHRTVEESGTVSPPGSRRRSAIRTGALALALTAVAASLAVLAPASANAAGNAVEIVSGYNGPNGSRVDVMWASQAPFTGAFLWPDNTSASQEFNLLDSGNGFYRIQARHSGQCLMLDWRGGTYTNGTRIIQYPACGAGYTPAEWSTRWIWRSNGCTSQCLSTGSWYRLIVNHRTGKCLDAANAAGGAPPVQAVLQQFDCITSANQWNAWNQMWTFATATSQLGPGPR